MTKKDIEKLTEDTPVYVEDIVKGSDIVRKRLLEMYEIKPTDTAPSVFDYISSRKDLGLNIVSNVDMGYAAAQVGEHMAKRIPYIRELEYNIKLMENSPNSILVLNGNLFTFVPKSKQTGLLSYKTQIAYYHSLFKDLAAQGKIMAIIRGTEEHRIDSLHKIDPLMYLAMSLGLENKVSNEALINVGFKDDTFGDVNVKLRSVNWQNVATTASYVKRRMHERATQKPGADVYFARTALNMFAVERESKIEDGRPVDKPIYLLSAGPYKPFAGAKSAGAEYNSIRDAELAPSLYWTKISATKSQYDNNDYEILARQKHYLAHQELNRGTDEVVSKITAEQDDAVEVIASVFVNKFLERKSKKSGENTQKIREVLEKNAEIEKMNNEIRKYRKFKKGIEDEVEEDRIQDAGSDIEKEGVFVTEKKLSEILFTEKDNTKRARYINEVVSPEAAFKGMEVSDGSFPEEATRLSENKTRTTKDNERER